MKSYRIIREKIGETKYGFAKKIHRPIGEYCNKEKKGKKIDPNDLKVIRSLANQAGISDTELLDILGECDPRLPRKKVID